jgi:SAM-dependent methyltransferase
MKQNKKIESLLKEKNLGIKLDIGGGGAGQKGFVNMDNRALPGVDIVQDVVKFPWPLPNESVSFAMCSHLLEHLPKGSVDSRIIGLVDLLLKKKLITEGEVKEYLGEVDPGPLFLRFMDEVWRILKPGSQFVFVLPYGGSPGYLQDPTHIAQFNISSWAYFDPLASDGILYNIYRPLPWKIVGASYALVGNMEICLEKRLIDPSYKVLSTVSK